MVGVLLKNGILQMIIMSRGLKRTFLRNEAVLRQGVVRSIITSTTFYLGWARS